MDGAPICNLLSQKDILLLYSSVLRERRVVVISYSLRYDNLAEVKTNDEKADKCNG
jgi:hypothetical protein